MKRMNNYQRVANYLVKIFKNINEEFYNNELEIPTITIQSTVSAYGHVSVSKVWSTDDGRATHELNLSADYLNRPIENIVATMIHESVHLYCMQAGIKDTSNNGVYHNKRFKAIAESKSLIISRHEKYGWTITEPSEATLEFCIKYGLEDIELVRQSSFSFGGVTGTGNRGTTTPIQPPKKKGNSRKWVCPKCGCIIRSTRTVNVICGDCNETFIEV